MIDDLLNYNIIQISIMIRDIINLIIKYCDFLILKKFDKIIKLRHREKKLKYSKNRNNFRCTGCTGKLIYHCSDKEMFHYINFFD